MCRFEPRDLMPPRATRFLPASQLMACPTHGPGQVVLPCHAQPADKAAPIHPLTSSTLARLTTVTTRESRLASSWRMPASMCACQGAGTAMQARRHGCMPMSKAAGHMGEHSGRHCDMVQRGDS